MYQHMPAMVSYHGDRMHCHELRGVALSQLEILRSEMRLRCLDISRRRVTDRQAGVVIECTVCHGISRVDIFTPVPLIVPIEKEKKERECKERFALEAERLDSFNAPMSDGSYFTALDCFRAGPNKGKMLAATGEDLYIQDTIGGSTWTKVAKVENNMDPAFVRISPSGSQIALGLGWNQNLLVFDTSILNSAIPTDLNINPNPDVKVYQEIHYDAVWVGETHLVINGGQWVVQGESAVSGVTFLDVTNASSFSQGLCYPIPGGSSSIAVDANNNLVFGIGDGENTGEIKLLKESEWFEGGCFPTSYMNYTDIKRVIADSVLSVATLGFDDIGNLYVGGGEFRHPPLSEPNLESGYVAVISSMVIQNAAAFDVNEASEDELESIKVVEITEDDEDYKTENIHYLEISPDVCRNDTATDAIATKGGVFVVWNTGGDYPGACTIGGNTDWWAAGVTPRVTEYKITEDEEVINIPEEN
jgi:hypothetical protein